MVVDALLVVVRLGDIAGTQFKNLEVELLYKINGTLTMAVDLNL